MEEPLVLESFSKAQTITYITLAEVANMYEGREDYRIVGGQMVMLLEKIYPLEGHEPRFTIDTDAALGDTDKPANSNQSVVELLEIADAKLPEKGFMRSGGSAYTKGNKPQGSETSTDYQEINFLQIPAQPSHSVTTPIRSEPVLNGQGSRQLDTLDILRPVLDAKPLKVTVEVPAISQKFSVCIPQVEQALMLKAQAVTSRGYLLKDVQDLLTLFRVKNKHPDKIPWKLDSENLKGSRRDIAAELHKIRQRIRRSVPDGLTRTEIEELRLLINDWVAQP